MITTTMENTDQTMLDQLCAQIELAWADTRATLVDRLAQEHPRYARPLYDFFALLVETEINNPALNQSEKHELANASAVNRSLLALLGEHAKLKASQIAAQLQVPYPLLVLLQRHALSVPQVVRQELARRAERIFQFDYATALQALSQPYGEAIAASRDTAYSTEEISFDELLKRAGLTKKEQQAWLKISQAS